VSITAAAEFRVSLIPAKSHTHCANFVAGTARAVKMIKMIETPLSFSYSYVFLFAWLKGFGRLSLALHRAAHVKPYTLYPLACDLLFNHSRIISYAETPNRGVEFPIFLVAVVYKGKSGVAERKFGCLKENEL
jgi:hypothetical protein